MGRILAAVAGAAMAALAFAIALLSSAQTYGLPRSPWNQSSSTIHNLSPGYEQSRSPWSSFKSIVLNGSSTLTYIETTVTYVGIGSEKYWAKRCWAVEKVTYGLDLINKRFYVHIDVLNSSPPMSYVQQNTTYWVNGSLVCFKTATLSRSGETAVETSYNEGNEEPFLLYAPFAYLFFNISGGGPGYEYFSKAFIRYRGTSTWDGQMTYCYSANITAVWETTITWGPAIVRMSNETICLLGDGVPVTISAVETSQISASVLLPETVVVYNATLISYEPSYIG
ncbi:MAG: hypothetical protein QXP98_07580 [Thermoproteus sp.]